MRQREREEGEGDGTEKERDGGRETERVSAGENIPVCEDCICRCPMYILNAKNS